MSTEAKTRRRRLNRLGAALLVAGWCGAAAIYVVAPEEPDDVLGYEFVDGVAYPLLASESKAYRHDLERLGGKSAVFADDLQRGFAALRTGKGLAGSLAALSLVAALLCFRAARRLPRDDDDQSGSS